MSNSIVLESADEFVRLRCSEIDGEQFIASWGIATFEIWKEVIDNHPRMRMWVAHNKTIPDEIIRILAVDRDRRVRSMIASKRRAPSDVLAILAKDEDETIRRSVAGHRNTTADTLATMLNDEWSVVAEIAKERLTEINATSLTKSK
ncbi:MAG: hypothetical protein V4534_02985 [Myxococcota bacterium]